MNYGKANILLTAHFNEGKRHQYDRKATIIKYNDVPTSAYYIEEGTVKVLSHTDTGSERIHYLYKEKEIFPLSYIFGRKLFDTTFVAFSDTVIWSRPIPEFTHFINENPKTLAAIVRQQVQIYERTLNLNLVSSEERVVNQIISLSERFGVVDNDRIVIKVPITIQELADSTRLSREKTGKVLRHLEDTGGIIFNRNRIILYIDRIEGSLIKSSSSKLPAWTSGY